MVVLKERDVMGAMADKLISMLGKFSTQNRQSKPFKRRVYKGRGQPLTNSGRGDQYSNNKIYRFYDKGTPCDKNRGYIRNNQNFRGRDNIKR